MTKRKSAKKKVKFQIPKLIKIFNCPLCGNKNSVFVEFIKGIDKGFLECHSCRTNGVFPRKRADKNIDIFYKWINELNKKSDEENKKEQK